MKLKPTQIVGLIAVIVFGGILAWTYTKPKRDPFRIPGATAMNNAPITAAPTLDPIPSVVSPSTPMTAPPPVPTDPTIAGSADARDDLYCQGVVYAAHRAATDPLDPKERRRLLMAAALASAGAGKLIKEGVATPETTAQFANAHADKAMADFAAGKLRIPVAACEARAEAVLKTLGQ